MFEPKTLKYLATLKRQPECNFFLGAFQRKKTLQTRCSGRGLCSDIWNEVRVYWRRLHIEEHCDLYCAVNTYYSNYEIKKDEMGGACSSYGAYRVLVGKPEGRRTLKTSS
jgi:hypothetical protein